MQKIISLDRCSVGDAGKIVALTTGDYAILRKLLGLGFAPGAKIRIIRCRPSILLRAGHSKVALDRCLAAQIMLERDD